MRGGAIPLIGWALVLAVLLAVNWIWTGDTIQVACFGFAVGVILAAAALLAARGRGDAVRRGPPPATREAEAVPAASLGAALAGISVATIGLGLAFGRFLVYFGAGVLIVSLGRVITEVAAQRRALRAWRERERR
jgi:hypothetical protein